MNSAPTGFDLDRVSVPQDHLNEPAFFGFWRTQQHGTRNSIHFKERQSAVKARCDGQYPLSLTLQGFANRARRSRPFHMQALQPDCESVFRFEFSFNRQTVLSR